MINANNVIKGINPQTSRFIPFAVFGIFECAYVSYAVNTLVHSNECRRYNKRAFSRKYPLRLLLLLLLYITAQPARRRSAAALFCAALAGGQAIPHVCVDG